MSGYSSHSIDEDVVFVYKNELIQGVIDKEQFGKYGLIHTVQEMYGSKAAGHLLTALCRVLIAFLQMMHGFTCGVHDLLLVQPCDNQRKKLLDACLNCGNDVHQQFIGREKEHLDSLEMQIGIEKAIRANGESAIMLLDGMMRSKLNTLSSAVTKLFPEGLVKPFRRNALSLMTLSGAKGGSFNFQQISLLLGQQELEGKRVPRMVSGKTLPCFAPWDSSARAGGFISDRYLTGLRPQEFYFHCMAGRKGLVDTAVKTSRSGYLQRCLIKNLECLSVNYDYTVRDGDGSIIQFRYGEDGVDVHKMSYIRQFEALALNQQLIASKNPVGENDDECFSKYVEEDNEVPNQLAKEAEEFLKNHAAALNSRHTHPKDCLNFLKLVKNKYYMSLAHPGEPVGIIAAQSIGEPSTQMTLNTFHHAGRGEMNVTLGIPRLSEILKDASKTIKTPTMTCPLLKCKAMDDAEQLAAKLKRISVADLIENMEVSVLPFSIKEHEICSIYKLKLKLYDPELYPRHTDVTLEDCQNTLLNEYLKKMEAAISSHLHLLSRISGIKLESQAQTVGSDEMDEDGSEFESQTKEDSDSEEEDDPFSSKARKKKGRSKDEVDYEDDDSEEEVEEEVELNEDEIVKESVEQEELKASSDPDSLQPQKEKSEAEQRKTSAKDRAIHVACDGLFFEVHFKLTNEPHILLTQIAQKTAEKVYVKNPGKIEHCKAVELHLDDSGNGGFSMLKKSENSRPALQTAGVDFTTFWNLQDELDLNFIMSNDIHSMLDTYGVEAARATIVAEIFSVFGHYGVTVDMRHLTLIADYMTHTGKYRPLNRFGSLAESISPLSKMAFVSKFITQAASGEVDILHCISLEISKELSWFTC
uniref:DNA-directed RNA polymerase n=1 Tax=Chenopodium quinoa TaxID=63459 RepID=A0A803LXG3_CHEQI